MLPSALVLLYITVIQIYGISKSRATFCGYLFSFIIEDLLNGGMSEQNSVQSTKVLLQLAKETDMSTSEEPSIQGVTVTISMGVKRVQSKADHSPPSSAEFQNDSCIRHDFTVCSWTIRLHNIFCPLLNVYKHAASKLNKLCKRRLVTSITIFIFWSTISNKYRLVHPRM
jgi:hypothetical protein